MKGPLAGGRLYGFVAVMVMGPLSVQGGGSPPELRNFLRVLDFGEGDFSAIERGEVVTKVPGTNDASEVAVFGVVKVNVPADFYVREFRDVETFRKSSIVPQVGTFSLPPGAEDLRELALPEADLEALRSCKVGACDVKLSAAQIEWLGRKVDWSAPNHLEQAADLSRQILFGQLESYLEGGDTSLGEYADKEEMLSVAEGFGMLLRNSRFLLDSVPEFYGYLAEFPEKRSRHVESLFYWSEESFGLKPVISLVHAAIYTRPEAGFPPILIARKRIYASHYFQAALGLTAVVEGSGAGTDAVSYVLFVNRARFDGKLSGVKRRLFRRRLRGLLDPTLKSARDRLEDAYRSERSAGAGR